MINLAFCGKIDLLCNCGFVVQTQLGFENSLRAKSSHLGDELLMVLGFLSFKGFPSEKLSCSVC